jgi:hypothetical protein
MFAMAYEAARAAEHQFAPALTPIIDLAATSAVCAAGGWSIGLIASRALRRSSLHWSWSLLAATAAVIGAAPFGAGRGATLAFGAFVAGRRCRRWHREDLEAGSDLAARARDRLTPLDAARVLGSRLASVRAARGEGAAGVAAPRLAARPEPRRELAIGRDGRGRVVSVPFGPLAGSGRHLLVVGATGSGKTVTQSHLVARAVELGAAAVVVDPKGDGSLLAVVREAAARARTPLTEWSPDGPAVYNFCVGGTDAEIADRLLAGERYTEPHYLRQAQRYIGQVVRALRCAGLQTSLRSVVEHLDPDRLEALARTLTEEDGAPIHRYIDSLGPRQRSELGGVRDRLAILEESEAGPWLDPARGRPFELLGAIRGREVVYFALEADRRPLLAQMLAAAIVQDLIAASAALQREPVPGLVVIDEFAALGAEQVVRLFARARSAGLSLVLGTQEFADLRQTGGEELLQRVMGNVSALIAHRQVVPASAELVCTVAGGRGAWRVSRSSDGRTTRTRTRERALEPDLVARLATGCAAVITFGSNGGGAARVASVFPPAAVAGASQ